MRFADVDRHLGGVQYMSSEQGRTVYDFIIANRLPRVLELGFAHGKSSCYFAAAADEIDGHLTTIDRPAARKREPNIDQLLERCGLTERVTPVYAKGSFTWELMKLLEQDPQPRFDFAYLDAGHTWDVTGFGFFLVDRLLAPGGWMLFDDLKWTIAASEGLKDSEHAKKLPQEQRTTPQVGKVFDLLVRTQPGYVNVRQKGNWGWAQKSPDAAEATVAKAARPTRRGLLAALRR